MCVLGLSTLYCLLRLLTGTGSSCIAAWQSGEPDDVGLQQPAHAGAGPAWSGTCPAQQYAAEAEHASTAAAAAPCSAATDGVRQTSSHKKAPDPKKDPSLVPGVETGDDVVAFYAKNGQDSSVKFFYCVRCS